MIAPIISQIGSPVGVNPDLGPSQYVLSTIDQVVSAVALLILVVLGASWAIRSRCDPLAGAPQRPNEIRDDSLALVVMIYLLAALAASGLTHVLDGDTDSVFVRLMAGSGVQLVTAGACLLIAAGRFQGGVRRFCMGSGDSRFGSGIVLMLVVTVLAVGLCPLVLNASMALVESVAPGHEFTVHPTIEALHDAGAPPGAKVVLWLGAAVIAPIAEEVFFRGLLQTFLVNVLRSRWIAIAVASLAFAGVHVSQAYAIPALALLAVLIGYVYERTGSLLPPIVLHAVFNLKTLLWDSLGAVPT